MLAPILVRKLKSASDPTACMGGTPSPKMRIGSSRTPPPTPVIPIRVPTAKPPRLLMRRSMAYRGLDRLRRRTDEAFPLEVQDNFLRRLFGGQVTGVNGDFGVDRGFVRIRDTREFF